jgi:hypothetical protein
MTLPTPDEVQADLLASKNIDLFLDRLNAKTEESKYNILARLLKNEFRRFKLPLG